MSDVKYTVEGVSLREYVSKNTNKRVVGYKIYVRYISPLYGDASYCDVWIPIDLFQKNPINFGDTLQLAFSPSGKLLSYNILERSK